MKFEINNDTWEIRKADKMVFSNYEDMEIYNLVMKYLNTEIGDK